MKSLNEFKKEKLGKNIYFEDVAISGFNPTSTIKVEGQGTKIGKALADYFEKGKPLDKSGLSIPSKFDSSVLEPANRKRENYSFTIIDIKADKDFNVSVEYRDTNMYGKPDNFLYIKVYRK